MSITNLTIPYSTPYQVSADDIDLIKIRSLETSPLTHEDLDDNFANLMNKVNALVDIIGGSSAAISVDGDGKVGIGTTNPGPYTLVVNDSTANGRIKIGSSNTAAATLFFGEDAGGGGTPAWLQRYGSSHATKASKVELGAVGSGSWIAIQGDGADVLNVRGSGNVGIGTTDPDHPLEVQAPGSKYGCHILDDQGASLGGLFVSEQGSTTDGLELYLKKPAGTTKIRLSAVDNNPTYFNAGNVGIGTADPAYPLEVHGPNGGGISLKGSSDTKDGWRLKPSGNNLQIVQNLITSGEVLTLQDGGNVGIGTTSPSDKLEVISDGTEFGATITNTTANPARLTLTNTEGSASIDCNENLLRLGNNTSRDLVIDSDGNAGIGTTSPLTKMYVQTSAGVYSSAQGINEGLTIDDPDQSSLNLYHGGEGSALSRIVGIKTASGNTDLAFITQNTVLGSQAGRQEWMRITSVGNVGIGTTNPDALLDVEGSLDQLNSASIVNNSSTGYGFVTKGGGNGKTRYIADFRNKDGLSCLKIDGDGNVGIGNTSPSHDLTLGSPTSAGTTDDRLKIYRGADDAGQNLEMGYRGITVTRDANALADPQSTFSIKQKGSDGERVVMQIDPDGNVGIGTTSPSATLDIQGTAKLNGNDLATVDQLGGGGIWAENTNGAYYNGNVGIGTTSPDEALHIKGDNKRMFIGSDDYNLFSLGRRSSTELDTAYLLMMDEGASKVVLDAKGDSYFLGGNVGIGTATPDYKLDLKQKDGGVQLQMGRTNTGAGSAWMGADSTGFHLGVGAYGTGNTVADPNGFTVGPAGNVGIGTTNPSAKLEVKSGKNGLPLYDISEDDVTALRVGGNDNAVIDMGTNGGSGTWIQARNAATDNIQYNLLLNPLGGNVGIGTASPNVKHEVHGDAIANGSSVSIVQRLVGEDSKCIFEVLKHSDTGLTEFRNNRYADGVNGDYAFSEGNVGIGTTSPEQKLFVKDGHFGIDGTGYILQRGTANTTNEYGVIHRTGYYQKNTGNHYGRVKINAIYNASSNASGLKFYTSAGGGNASSYVFGLDSDGTAKCVYDLEVSGDVSKGSGTFKIDHPLPEKSETHHLVHSFIEGPQADNIYRGKVELVAGKAEVNIDTVSGMTEGTFVALNRDIQTFTSNESDWDAVRGKVEGNKLIIECQNAESTATVSWLVIGERQDEHMYKSKTTDDNGKLIVEPLKPEPEPEYEEVEPVVEEVSEEPVAEEAPVEEPQPEEVATEEPQVAQVSLGQVSLEQVSLGQVSLGQVSLGQVSLSESPLDEIKEIRAEDGKEYVRIGDKEYEVLGENEDGSLLLDDDTTNNG